jgi:hypothetical protein
VDRCGTRLGVIGSRPHRVFAASRVLSCGHRVSSGAGYDAPFAGCICYSCDSDSRTTREPVGPKCDATARVGLGANQRK